MLYKELQSVDKGYFGEIFKINENTLLKVMEYGINENLNEVCFLSSYKHIPFITQIIKCEIKNSKILLYMKNAGKTLKDKSKTMCLDDKIKILPILLNQICRILLWIEEEKILHCDIKPENICINDDNFITLIDWSHVNKVYNGNIYSNGTKIYNEPETYHCKRIDYSSEMFSFGISLIYFLFSDLNYIDWEEFCDNFYTNFKNIDKLNEIAFDILGLEKLKNKFIDIFKNDKYYNILSSMVNINTNKRIKTKELFNFCDFSLYPIIIKNEYKYNFIIPEFQKLNKKKLGILINWLIDVKFVLKLNTSLFDSIVILFKYINIKKIDINDFQIIGIVCLYISTIINNENLLTIETCMKLCYEKNNDRINSLLFDILDTLNFDMFIPNNNFECENNVKEYWKNLFLDSKNNFKNIN